MPICGEANGAVRPRHERHEEDEGLARRLDPKRGRAADERDGELDGVRARLCWAECVRIATWSARIVSSCRCAISPQGRARKVYSETI